MSKYADKPAAEIILQRGGKRRNVQEAGHLVDKILRELAELANKGDKAAELAIKVAKDARRLGQKY